MTKHTPTACLSSITITASHLEGTESLDDEFRIIKRVYHEKILKEHPVSDLEARRRLNEVSLVIIPYRINFARGLYCSFLIPLSSSSWCT
jgi:hypothetical protein